MTTTKIVIDAHIQIDINETYFRERDQEKRAKWLEREAESVKDFIRDHKSMDVNDVYVVREYGYKCEHCGYVYDTNEKQPECCEKATREWATDNQLLEFGYEILSPTPQVMQEDK